MNTETTEVKDWMKAYPNEAERKLALETAKLVGFKDKMPVIKSARIPYPEASVAGYLVRFDNWSAKLRKKLYERSLEEQAKKRNTFKLSY